MEHCARRVNGDFLLSCLATAINNNDCIIIPGYRWTAWPSGLRLPRGGLLSPGRSTDEDQQQRSIFHVSMFLLNLRLYRLTVGNSISTSGGSWTLCAASRGGPRFHGRALDLLFNKHGLFNNVGRRGDK